MRHVLLHLHLENHKHGRCIHNCMSPPLPRQLCNAAYRSIRVFLYKVLLTSKLSTLVSGAKQLILLVALYALGENMGWNLHWQWVGQQINCNLDIPSCHW